MRGKYDYFVVAFDDRDAETHRDYNTARRCYSSAQCSATLYGVKYDNYSVILSK